MSREKFALKKPLTSVYTLSSSLTAKQIVCFVNAKPYVCWWLHHHILYKSMSLIPSISCSVSSTSKFNALKKIKLPNMLASLWIRFCVFISDKLALIDPICQYKHVLPFRTFIVKCVNMFASFTSCCHHIMNTLTKCNVMTMCRGEKMGYSATSFTLWFIRMIICCWDNCLYLGKN